ncbi:MAG: GIY-YIG nuclease family protein, partial [Chitinophagaceae bacterium]
VYILYSARLAKFYTGTTNDVDRRLEEHNSRLYKDAFSVKGVPWSLFLQIPCESSQQAYALERFIKKMKSASFIRRLKEQPEIIEALLQKINNGEIGIPRLREMAVSVQLRSGAQNKNRLSAGFYFVRHPVFDRVTIPIVTFSTQT